MTASVTKIEREALSWLVQVNDPAFEAWDAWDAWMELDPHHSAAYWRLAESEADVVQALTSGPARPARPLPARRVSTLHRRSAIATAVAAVALCGVWYAWGERPQPWSIQTAAGQQRTVTLTDGSRVSMDGGTRLTLDRRDPRNVTLDAGRALFEVTHDARRPFRVDVGDVTLTDLGTTFDVTRLAVGSRISVSEGSVRVDRDRASTILRPGDSVLAGPERLERRPIAIAAVSDWRTGRLAYADETLGVVAQDLERALDRRIRVAPALVNRRFSGSLSIQTLTPDPQARLSRLLGVRIIEDGESWRLEP